jgi:hypothetical protein
MDVELGLFNGVAPPSVAGLTGISVAFSFLISFKDVGSCMR